MKNHLLIHVPHASARTHAETFPYLIDPSAEVMRVTDWYTDELFAGYERAMFVHSRLFCDVERFIPDPLDERGQGFAYTKTLDGEPLRELSPVQLDTIRDLYHEHHDKLVARIEAAVSLMPVVIIDAHSYSAEQARLSGWEGPTPDIGLGYDRDRFPAGLISDLAIYFGDAGMTLGLNIPYPGSILPERYAGHPDVRSIMFEVNKRLYLEPGTNVKSEWFTNTRQVLAGALKLVEDFDFSGA
jgi:N-formylglutamate amidohydrolase